MRYEVGSSDIQHYKDNGKVEFEGLISQDKAQEAASIIEKEYSLFCDGRDLYQKNDLIRSITLNKGLIEIGAQLSRTKVLRYQFDQAILKTHDHFMPFYQTVKMRKIACHQGCQVGLLLCLKEGNGMFIAPYEEIELSTLFEESGGAYLLISYGSLDSRYIFNENDPCTHLLKKKSYGYGDLLKDETHPVISFST